MSKTSEQIEDLQKRVSELEDRLGILRPNWRWTETVTKENPEGSRIVFVEFRMGGEEYGFFTDFLPKTGLPVTDEEKALLMPMVEAVRKLYGVRKLNGV